MDCSICILAPKMIECYDHPNINVLSYSEVDSISGKTGDFKVKVTVKARCVDIEKCTGCGECMEKCPVRKIPDEHDMGLAERRAIYLPFMQAVPRVALIDKEHCIYFTKDGKCGACKKICKRGAIDYDEQDTDVELDVAAIVVATGFDQWDPSSAPEYGYGKYPNVYTAMEYERIINASGPTGGHIKRRSDEQEPKSIAWIQCVGSRTTKHFPYCSSVCCMYATKEAMLVKEHSEATATIFYKDMRAFGKGFNEFIERARTDYGVTYINSDAVVEENPDNHNPIIVYDVAGKKTKKEFEMVVLSPALTPSVGTKELAQKLGVEVDEWNFIKSPNSNYSPIKTTVEGIYVAGYCHEPMDIPESITQGSAAASQALEILSQQGD
jgi:heterodisulfide reductase subunit A